MNIPLCPHLRLAKDGRQVIVRSANLDDDVQIVANINTIAAEEEYLQTDSFNRTPKWEAALRHNTDSGMGLLLIVAVVDSIVVGHLRVFSGDYGTKDRHVGSIGIALLLPYRGIGIGTILLECALNWTLQVGYEKLEAHVIASNLKARQLFEKHGFVVEALRHRQLKISDRYEDELIMARPIQSVPEMLKHAGGYSANSLLNVDHLETL